jgi:hypothetical protein
MSRAPPPGIGKLDATADLLKLSGGASEPFGFDRRSPAPLRSAGLAPFCAALKQPRLRVQGTWPYASARGGNPRIDGV